LAMSQQTKFNVIIPTRERADTLYYCLRTVVEQAYDNLNIIISDNYSQDNTREVVESFSDKRIKYINTGKRISMSENWEFALSHVKDGWVTFLGDDDGMLPDGLARITSVIDETDVQAITSRWGFYFWPRSTTLENQLTVPLSRGYEERDCKVWLAKLMKGNANYHDLPYVYTGGFVNVELINKARNKKGEFFCSMIPDVYSAVALASTADRYVMLHEPICVMGVSSHSGGASSFGMGKNEEPAQKFYSEKNIPYHSKLGSERVKSIQIIIYESYLQSMHLHNDILKVDMCDQLALALGKSSSEYYHELRKYCDEVVFKNGIDAERLEKAIRLTKNKGKKWMNRIKLIILYLKELTIDTSQYSVTNVYGAALLTNALYQFNVSHKHWHLRKLFTLIKNSIFTVLGSKRNLKW
jgi:glycosyltransferase involved in cell wall biosynthesis